MSVPRPGIEPWPWQWKHWILTIRPADNPAVLFCFFLKQFYLSRSLLRAWAFSGCGSSSFSGGFLWSTGARCTGFSGHDMWPRQLWRMGLIAPQRVGSSRIRGGTHVPCTGRQILIHCATKDVLFYFKWVHFYSDVTFSWLYWQIAFCGGGNLLGVLAKV